MSRAPLLLEIGCEEIPARMIADAATEFGRRVVSVLDKAGLDHGRARCWGGSRRLAVRVEDVSGGQADGEERILGPSARVAFTADGEPTKAALGFARKYGVDPTALERIATDRGGYVAFTRQVKGQTVGRVLAAALPAAVGGMSFPKTMRWADGTHRWVRPVHWVLALHGEQVLPVELFGVCATGRSQGHRFLAPGSVDVDHPGRYLTALETAFVVVDPEARRKRLAAALSEAATELGGYLLEDAELLDEVASLVEWPGVVAGRFESGYLDLPREILVTTLRHHQKCFSVQGGDGNLLAAFLAVANTDRDPAGNVCRGNEWVVGGRLEDARFFWNEDRKLPLEARSPQLDGIVLHAEIGTYADKAVRMEALARRMAEHLKLDAARTAHCCQAAGLAKNDLLSGTVGEFPELQGVIGGLLLESQGSPPAVARAVYGHYRPMGPEDGIPDTVEGCVVSLADKLDAVTELVRIGQAPTGSRDPFGLRRAANGVFRVVLERRFALSLGDLCRLSGGDDALRTFVLDRLQGFLRDSGFSSNEILAVFRPRVSDTDAYGWQLHDIVSRIEAVREVRRREDFARLVDLTKRVDNIITKNPDVSRPGGMGQDFVETQQAALELKGMVDSCEPVLNSKAASGDYGGVIDTLADFVQPVDAFFEDVLVIDTDDPRATCNRYNLLVALKDVLTRYFDIRELAGQADRST